MVTMFINSVFTWISLHAWKHMHLNFRIQCLHIPNFLKCTSRSIRTHINFICIHILYNTNICKFQNSLSSSEGPNNEAVHPKLISNQQKFSYVCCAKGFSMSDNCLLWSESSPRSPNLKGQSALISLFLLITARWMKVVHLGLFVYSKKSIILNFILLPKNNWHN
jgi:hypothetical protein